ncbi:Hypothetical protein A7982_07212 [Minicystis rosea]|nr:Hypothetical protein A7982_07212 [Minicystis rosea]
MVMRDRNRALHRRLHRTSERGATLFVVLLVMSLLMGIGAFAARSAHLATASSGYVRHQTQARYIGEYSLMLATSLLTGNGGQSYLDTMGKAADMCTAQAGANMVTRSCYKMSYNELQGTVHAQGYNLCDVAASNTVPGSLGLAQAECSFLVELTDKTMGATPSGFDTAGGAGTPLKFFYVTATTTAQVRLISAVANALDATAAQSSSTQTLRSRILAGPYPASAGK